MSTQRHEISVTSTSKPRERAEWLMPARFLEPRGLACNAWQRNFPNRAGKLATHVRVPLRAPDLAIENGTVIRPYTDRH
jgi:hypothetical protein